MVTLDEVAALALALPEVGEGVRYGHRTWQIRGKVFVWERPFSKADIKRFGDEPVPAGPIAAITTSDLAEKEAILAANPRAFFTIEHFNNYAAVLVQLDKVSKKAFREALLDGWLAAAPAVLAKDYLSERKPR